MIDLPLIFAAGLLGGTHCIGMCGGFVMALGTTPDGGVMLVIGLGLIGVLHGTPMMHVLMS